MPTEAQKWLIGCGIGCLVFVLAIVGLGIGGGLFLRGIMRDLRETSSAREALAERHGDPNEFCPDPEGGVRPERVEAFLRAREIMAPARAELEETLSLLSDKERKGPILKIGAGAGLIPQIIDFDTRRSEVLLETGMGLGEYQYLYAMAFYCWLGHSPADGPPFTLMGHEEEERDARDEFDVREDRRELILLRLNGLFRNQLGLQFLALPSGGEPEDEELELWRARLEAEVAALEGDPYRLAWIEDLPPPLEESLRPFRERLEASYSPLCNPSEMGFGL